MRTVLSSLGLMWVCSSALAATVGDRAWHDLNADGIQNPGESGLAGVRVEIYHAGGGLAKSAVTSSDGSYSFQVSPGEYYLRFVSSSAYALTKQDQGQDDGLDSDPDPSTQLTGTFAVGDEDSQVHWDAGFTSPAAIRGVAWVDANRDGVRDAGESPAAGVEVLLSSGGQALRVFETDEGGAYAFEDLEPGMYSVLFAAPAGFVFSPQDRGGNDDLDSDVWPDGTSGPHQALSACTLRIDAGLMSERKATPRASTAPGNSAVFLGTDAESKGNWRGAHGSDGYDIFTHATSLPAYASLSVSNNESFVWETSSADVRALRKPSTPDDRVAACHFAYGEMTYDLQITDGQTHRVSLYMLDIHTTDRTQTVQILDADTEAVLDTRAVAEFNGGVYYSWEIGGHVKLVVQNTGPTNAVVCAFFFGSGTPAAEFVGIDTTHQGNWAVEFGDQGYYLINDAASLPSFATLTPSGHSSFTWDNGTTDVRALHRPGAPTDRLAATWFAFGSMTLDFDLAAGDAHRVALYFLDWDTTTRSQTVEILNGETDAVLDSRGVSDFNGGVYLIYKLTGHLKIRISNTGPSNAVISGIFIGHGLPSATFQETNTTNKGNWKGIGGVDGYHLVNTQSSLPAYIQLDASGIATHTWADPTADVRALTKNPNTFERIASTMFDPLGFSVDLNLVDGLPHRVGAYFLDFDSFERTQTIEVRDARTDALLDSRTISNFHEGIYLFWTIKGHVKIRVLNTGPTNAVLCGLFFGEGLVSANFVGTDATTQGNWKSNYGLDGHDVVNDDVAYPAYANVTSNGPANHTWASNTSDIRALEKVTAPAERIAATVYDPLQFEYNIEITDGDVHRVALYFLDFDTTTRAQRVEFFNANTNELLDTRDVTEFNGGIYFIWEISGKLRVRITNTGPTNAVLSGIFFGQNSAPALSESPVASPATITIE